MSQKIQSKQIDRLLSAFIGISSLAVTAGTSDVVTGAITTAASTAADNGNAVPVQVATTGAGGFVASGPFNRVIIQGADGGAIESPDDTEVYGRLTESGGAYTLSYFYLATNGTETAYTMAAGNVNAFVPYTFRLDELPTSALLRVKVADVAGAGGSMLAEVLITPTSANALPNLPVTPAAGAVVTYSVNGKGEDELAGGAISRSGAVLTWSATNAGYDLETTDRVTALYTI